MINFDSINEDDRRLTLGIVNRACSNNNNYDPIELEMDITAAHIANPLTLEKLLHADDFNFLHDVSGIHRHIDRETGEMNNCFRPRFSAR